LNKGGYHSAIYVKSKYSRVEGIKNYPDGIIKWFVRMKGFGKDRFLTEKEAAIAVDKLLISKGLQPVNILKKVI
jgi:hypothetical protein